MAVVRLPVPVHHGGAARVLTGFFMQRALSIWPASWGRAQRSNATMITAGLGILLR